MAFTTAEGGEQSWDRQGLGPQWPKHTSGTLAAYDGANAYNLQETIHMTHRPERSAVSKVDVQSPSIP